MCAEEKEGRSENTSKRKSNTGSAAGMESLEKVWNLFFQFPDLEKVWKFVKSFGNFKRRFGTFCLLLERKILKTENVPRSRSSTPKLLSRV